MFQAIKTITLAVLLSVSGFSLLGCASTGGSAFERPEAFTGSFFSAGERSMGGQARWPGKPGRATR